MSEHPPAVGIDLGTTYSVVARLDEQRRPQTLPNAEGDSITPSVVLLDGDEVIVGKEALKAMATDMERVADCAKRQLGTRAYDKRINGLRYPPEVLEAWVLNKLRIDAQRLVGDFSQVVITVPAYFDEVRRKATQDAGYIAGFEVLDIINEPTAAAVAAGFQPGQQWGQQEEAKILVYDLGGGTFDVTVMEVGQGEFVALATDGDVQLGGRDWDQRLVDHAADAFASQFGIDPRSDPNACGRLWREAEDIKRTLSARNKAVLTFDCQGRPLKLDVTREQFESLTADLLERTAFTTRQTLQAAGLQWPDIDRVLLVGGSTRMPAVMQMLQRLTGRPLDRSVSPDEAVAHGAALHAGRLLEKMAGQKPKFTIRNVNSHSLGVAASDPQTRQSRTAVLIPRNTPLPASARRTFQTKRASQKNVLVEIVEGEAASPEDCSQIGRFVVDLPDQLPAQTPVQVEFQYHENGRLAVHVAVAGTNVQCKQELVRENALTPRQLDDCRKLVSNLPPLEKRSGSAP